MIEGYIFEFTIIVVIYRKSPLIKKKNYSGFVTSIALVILTMYNKFLIR